MKFTILLLVLIAAALMFFAGCERKIVNETQDNNSTQAIACFGCHGDDENALVEARQQYNMSVHGTGDTWNRNRNNSSRYQSCEQCHTHEGFVANLSGASASGEGFSRISCFTCHAPHTTGELEVRVQTAVTLLNGATFDRGPANQCAACHHSRADVTTFVVDSVELSSHWGPHHSVQADLLMGTNGYEFAGYSYDNLGPHTNTATRGCLNCHMANNLYATGGHTFNVHDLDEDYENTYGCNAAAPCHDGDVDDFEYQGVQMAVDSLLDSLKVLLINATLWDDVNDEPMDARIVETADSAGALFNFLMVEEDRSEGIHNPDYIMDLLNSSIDFFNNGGNGVAPNGLIAAH